MDKEKLDREFETMTDEAGLSKDEKNELSRRVNMKAIMYNPARIRKVCEHIAKHFKEKIEPNGYKGQVVVYDRECCLMYKAVLDELLQSQGLTRGVHYDVQAVLRDADGRTVRSESGGTLRPDVILHLDQNRDVIIDSKVSLAAFMEYVNASDEQ